MTVEINNFPFRAKIGMVFTSYTDHLPFMKYALTQYRKIDDMFIVGAFDKRLITPESHKRNIPYGDIWSLAHMWVTKHHTFGGHAKRHGWIWSHIYASSVLRTFPNIKHIFTSNGDCIWERPQGVHKIIEILGDNDFMSGQSYTRSVSDGFNFIHTCSMVFSREAYFSFVDYIIDNVSKETATVSFSPESLINKWSNKKIDDKWVKNRKWIHAPIQPFYPDGSHDMYCESNADSTWKRLLGFRNLEAEKNYRREMKLVPLPSKYFDLRDKNLYKDVDRNSLIKYYETENLEYLEKWYKYGKKDK
jgi:hypothetical protein